MHTMIRGGVEVVRDYAGKDATEGFDEVGHSKEAHRQLEELLVGRLDQAVCVHVSALVSCGFSLGCVTTHTFHSLQRRFR
jgi:cytochrome b involved in lipid metabolism